MQINNGPSYTQGVWTPALALTAGGPPTLSHQVGTYVTVGKIIFVVGSFGWSALNGANGAVTITGLPFPSAVTSSRTWPVTISSNAALDPYGPLPARALSYIIGYITVSSSVIGLSAVLTATGIPSTLQNTDLANAGTMSVSAMYMIA